MGKILFVIKSYPPRQSANVQCDAKIIKSLLTDKHEIHCLVSKFYNEEKEECVNNIHVHRVNRGMYWNIYTYAREHDSILSRIVLKFDRVLLRIKQIITIPIYPVYEPFLQRRIARKAIELHKKENFDIVISEYHGMESLHAGRFLKLQDPQIKFLPILWDPLIGKIPAKYLPYKYANEKIERFAERELGNADAIIAMESSRIYYAKRSNQISYYRKMLFLDIPGIINPSRTQIKGKFIVKGKINIVYAGVLTLPDRDPGKILQAMANARFAKDINMVFICTGAGKEKLDEYRNSFPGSIVVSNYVKKQELAAIYQEADIFLNFGGSNPNMVPSKLFEYMSYGKPIISTYYIDDEASLSYVNRYPLSIRIDYRNSIQEISKIINEELWPLLGKTIEFSKVEEVFLNNTPERYKEVIGNLLRKNGNTINE